MSILVTGGAGFIGSNVVDRLIKLDKDVIIIDNLSTGKKENINNKSKFYNIDLTSKEIIKIFKKHNIKKVIHLGAQIDVKQSVDDPIFDSEVNILGSINLFQNCIKYGVKKIVYASSAAVYGEPNYLPLKEDHPIKADSPYGISKYTPEHYLRYFSSEHDLEYMILRYSNVYGPRQSSTGEGGVIAIFIDRMLKDKRPIIYGDGKQSRDFIYIEDIVNANIEALNTAHRKTLNISTRTETTVNRLVKIINEELDKDLKPIYEDKRRGDIRCSILDNSKALKYLDWEPEYDIKEGIRKTINYYLQRS